MLEDPQDGCEVQAFGNFFRSSAESVELEPREERVLEIAGAARRDVASAVELAGVALAEAGLAGATTAVDAPLGPGAMLPGAEADPDGSLGGGILRALRAIKTPLERRRLAAAAALAERAIMVSAEAIEAGSGQAEIARAYRHAVVAGEGRVRMDNVSFDRGAALGNVNQPGDCAAPGSVIRYDVGAIVEGYESDLSRCFSLGPAPERARETYAALAAGVAAGLDRLRPGITCAELFETVVEATRAAGLPHYERTNVGHGIGIHGDGYDAPLLSADNQQTIEPGMVLCVEAPYYELGFAGLQVEDMVHVTADGWEPLSHLPRDLVELP